MTREEFREYLRQNNCSIYVIPGDNITGQSVKIENDRFPSEYTYIRLLPINDWELPDRVIIDACDALAIPCPPELDC